MINAVRNRDSILAWANTLDSQLTPLVPGNLPWTWFLTLTFAHPVPSHHALSAGRSLERWCSRWSIGSASGLPYFHLLLWSAEEHRAGNVHLHALGVSSPVVSLTHCRRCHVVDSSDEPAWKLMKESWFIHHGIARIFPYNPDLTDGAQAYVTKYVLKETCLDWGVWTG